jgi:hypothetical protein
MAEINHYCDVNQGFNFVKDAQDKVGHITAVKIGDKELAVDLTVTNPEELSGDKVKVVGVVSSINWQGGYADSMICSCQVSNANKKDLGVMVHSDLSNTKVEFKFNIYEYDPEDKKYFKCFHTDDAVLNGLVEKQGGQLSIAIADEENQEVVSPLNYEMNLGVMPEDTEQETHIAFSVSQKLVKRWGVTVAA